ncbi:hypothetical protein MNB_SUP05-SYMBIONT-4-394 [hydrothermal vent metagenome]|uniref:Uncharacterized protein n=1 Tax=hydrothermal vent metagenome TaxID=652676 RepID=A0A1W1DW68_9ZZZZ
MVVFELVYAKVSNGISVKFSLRFTSYNFNNIAQTNSTRYQQVEPVVIFINNSYAHTV